MIDHQTNKEMILIDEVSDEAVEAAGSVALGGLPTLPHTYCFACPADPPSEKKTTTCVSRLQCNVVR